MKEKASRRFGDVPMWHCNKDVETTLAAMKKMISFLHSREIDMLKLGYLLPKLANRFLHSSTGAAFCPFCEKDRDYDNFIQKLLTEGPSFISTGYAKGGQTKFRESENTCNSVVGIDASLLCPFL